MTKHYCDRCGKLLGEEDFKYPIHIQPKELCVKCATEYDATESAIKVYADKMRDAYWGKKDACKKTVPNETARA